MMTFLDSKIASLVFIARGFSTLFLNRITYRVGGLVFLLACFTLFELFFPRAGFSQNFKNTDASLDNPIRVATHTLFTEEVVTKKQEVTFDERIVVDETLREGETKVIQEGSSGEKVYATTITYHNGQEYERKTVLVANNKPTAQVIAVAPENKEIETPDGVFKYSRKLNVWATSYDPRCTGCSGITAIGLKAGFGVIAVDPKVIPLRSKVYVPGYGVAIAGDTGGAIKGNKIDLGFNDISEGWWSSRYTDIYLLSE